jgi:ligand-binding sensor domain-containing protein
MFFFLDSHHYGWLGLPERGAIRFTLKNDSSLDVIEHFLNIPSNNRSICGNSVWSIYEDGSGGIWIGTESGVSKFTYNSQLFSEVSIAQAHYNFESTVVNCLKTDEKNNIWIGSLGDTIYCISSMDKKIARIICAAPNEFQLVNQMLLTKNKKLFAGTNRGLYVMDLPDQEALFRMLSIAPPPKSSETIPVKYGCFQAT